MSRRSGPSPGGESGARGGTPISLGEPVPSAGPAGSVSSMVDRPESPTPWPLERDGYTLRLRTYLPSTKQALNSAVRRVLEIADACGCGEDDQTDLEIALREALANAMIHGNSLHDHKSIFLRCYGAPESALLVIVRDEGPGFAPEEVPDPRGADRMHLHHGRGLFLMRELMDYVEHRKNGREVVLFTTMNDSPSSDS